MNVKCTIRFRKVLFHDYDAECTTPQALSQTKAGRRVTKKAAKTVPEPTTSDQEPHVESDVATDVTDVSPDFEPNSPPTEKLDNPGKYTVCLNAISV